MLRNYSNDELLIIAGALYIKNNFDKYKSTDEFFSDLLTLFDFILASAQINRKHINIDIDDSLFPYDGTIYINLSPNKHSKGVNRRFYYKYKTRIITKFNLALSMFPKLDRYIKIEAYNHERK